LAGFGTNYLKVTAARPAIESSNDATWNSDRWGGHVRHYKLQEQGGVTV
jgi:hypothetical protein